MAELFRILEDFSKAGIETILVKGPLVSLLAYGDPGVRSFVDLDLIVRHEQILEASRRMTALGLDRDVPEAAIVAGKVPGEWRTQRRGRRRSIGRKRRDGPRKWVLLERAMFRLNMGGGIAGAGYSLRLSLSPTEQDWEEGAKLVVRRPFRLIRKYGQGG